MQQMQPRRDALESVVIRHPSSNRCFHTQKQHSYRAICYSPAHAGTVRRNVNDGSFLSESLRAPADRQKGVDTQAARC
jgi:hypothetical protein